MSGLPADHHAPWGEWDLHVLAPGPAGGGGEEARSGVRSRAVGVWGWEWPHSKGLGRDGALGPASLPHKGTAHGI